MNKKIYKMRTWMCTTDMFFPFWYSVIILIFSCVLMFECCMFVCWSGSVNDLINLSKLQQRKSGVEKNCKNGLNEASCGALQKVFLL